MPVKKGITRDRHKLFLEKFKAYTDRGNGVGWTIDTLCGEFEYKFHYAYQLLVRAGAL